MGNKSVLKIGAYVVMNDRYHVCDRNKERVFVVRSSVQEIGGTPCVFLRHYTGAYAADGLTKITIDQAEEMLKKRVGAELVDCLWRCWENETNDEETQEWRGDLANDEVLLVEIWDKRYDQGLAMIAKKILGNKTLHDH